MDQAVERAIARIWQRYSEPLPIAELAAAALLSRFHFVRVFRNVTGITPARFLAAVRIYQAKRLLQTTSMRITDVSLAVGYNSVGSFTNHFTRSVGVSPGRFRRISWNGGFGMPRAERETAGSHGTVTGTITRPAARAPAGGAAGRAYVGAFRTPILQHRPAVAAVVDVPGGYVLPAVPAGTWFIQAVAGAGTGPALLTGGQIPVTVTAGGVTRAAIRLRPGRLIDPPALLALPELQGRAEAIGAGGRNLPAPAGSG